MSLLRQTSSRYAQLRPRPHGISVATPAHHPLRRTFHLAATFNHAATLTAEGISSVHHAGLPWYITIPLVAVGVNFTARLPLQYYARRLLARRSELTPVVHAWYWRHIRSIQARGAPTKESDTAMAAEVSRLTMKSQKRIFKSFGVQGWKSFLPFATMVPFVLVSESLRRLCGVSVRVAGVPIGEDAASSAATAVASIPAPAVDAVFDPSLAQGGLLWFTDLILADPYSGLPLLCSAVLAWSSWGNMTQDRLRGLLSMDKPGTVTGMSRVQKALQRLLLGLPLVPLFLNHLPAAIFLYWLTNFSLTHVNDLILSRIVPIKPSHLKAPTNKEARPLPYLPASYPPGTATESSKVGSAETVKKD